jgi:hypothetical protein
MALSAHFTTNNSLLLESIANRLDKLTLIHGMVDKMNKINNTKLRVTIVSICFESSAIVGRMLESVPAGIRVILIDNGSADFALTMAIGRQYGAKIILNTANRGFGAACNQGAAAAGVESEFLFFLNPDAALTDRTIE